MKELVYLNGEFIARDEAKISPDDRGFIFADGVYEVVKYYKGKPFCFDGHLERLKNSLSQLYITYKGLDELKEIMWKLLKENGLTNKDAGVYVQITRGVSNRVHYLRAGASPTTYIFTFELPSNKDNIEHGIQVLREKDIRWQRCDIKSVSLLPNTMLFDKAHRKGAGETILIRDGFVTEATHSSVFGIIDGTVYTHPLSNNILPGITRKVVLDLCVENGIKIVEEAISEDMLAYLDEMFITGTGSEITPVVRINTRDIGNGKPGQITRKLQALFFSIVNE